MFNAVINPLTRLSVRHETQYLYSSPVDIAHHLAHLHPRSEETQRVCAFEIQVTPQPQQESVRIDTFGNKQTYFSLLVPHVNLSVVSMCTVDILKFQRPDDLDNTLPVKQVMDKLTYRSRVPYEPASQYVYSSPHVPLHDELKAYAADLMQPHVPIARAAIALMQRIHQDFRYAPSTTDISTPLFQVFENRQGVCQDFAHLMIACLRASGLAARYVSGYLLTQGMGENVNMVGADASHAWVSVWCPSVHAGQTGEWLDLDPTNNCLPTGGHVCLAYGRDFGDVTPLRGVIRGGGKHTLQVRVTTQLLSL